MRFKDDADKGYYDKFTVTRNDSSPNHPDCTYLVLDLDHDECALAAAHVYAHLVEHKNPKLCRDLLQIIGRIFEDTII
jgi:hypothetical protein